MNSGVMDSVSATRNPTLGDALNCSFMAGRAGEMVAPAVTVRVLMYSRVTLTMSDAGLDVRKRTSSVRGCEETKTCLARSSQTSAKWSVW